LEQGELYYSFSASFIRDVHSFFCFHLDFVVDVGVCSPPPYFMQTLFIFPLHRRLWINVFFNRFFLLEKRFNQIADL